MIEDQDLNFCLKAALEAEGAIALRPGWRLRRARFWPRALLAASVAGVFALAVWLKPAPHDALVDVLELVAEIDDVELTSGASTVDWLNAWQEAPCAQLL